MATAAVRLTYLDLDRLADEHPADRLEVGDGALVVTPPPTVGHQGVSSNTVFALETHVRAHRLGRVYTAPVGVRFTPDNVVQPDIVVLLNERLHIAGAGDIDGAPDLVVEILSPSTRSRDLGAELARRARFGVQEYWVLDPIAASARVLALVGDRYGEVPVERGVARSRVLPGFAGAVADLFAGA